MMLDEAGLLQGVAFIDSPNCDERPADMAIELVVVHGISLPPGQFGGVGVEQLFTDALDHDAHPYYEQLRGMRVSAHFFIRRDGSVIQFVPCSRRAWHAGASSWQGRERCNDFSVGIELEGADDIPYEAQQYAALAKLIFLLRARYPIRDVVGHSEIAPGRKTDPGSAFDWPRLHALLRGD